MPIQTYVENGCLVGYHPPTGASVRVPLREIFVEAGADFGDVELGALDAIPGGETIFDAIDTYAGSEVGGPVGKKIKAGLKKAVKKVASSKIVKGIAKVVSKVVPPPLNAPILAAQGAAKFAKAVKGKNAKATKLKGAVAAAAKGQISSKQLEAKAKKLGVKPSIVTDAAAVKRLALDAEAGDPKAAAAFKLASDVVSTEPAQQQLALAAAAQAQAGPNARAFIVQAPGGQTYRTIVQSS